MDVRELHNNRINIYHSEIPLVKQLGKTVFVITEEKSTSHFKSYQVMMPKFVRDGILLSPTIKTFYWYCLN